jgi:hypothetical protein
MMQPATPTPSTYKELCSNPSPNPLGEGERYHDELLEMYTSWSALGLGPAIETELRAEFLIDNTRGLVGGVGVFVKDDDDNTSLQILHNFRPHAGERRSTHRGEVFAYLGDAQGQDIELVQYRAGLLGTTSSVRLLPTNEAIHAALAADATVTMLDSPDPDEEGRNVKTRHGMLIPWTLLPYVLVEPALSPREAFMTVYAAALAEGLQDICVPLLDFLAYSCTWGPDRDDPETFLESPGSTPARALDVRNLRREIILYEQLPALRPNLGPHADNPALEGILGAMQEVRNGFINDIADRRLDRMARKAPRTVEDRYKPGTLDRLCKMCGTESDTLPPLYHALANHKKADGTIRSILQDHVEQAAHQMGIRHIPTMTVQHATALNGWVFFGASDQSIGEGFMPFSIVPPNQVSASAVAATQEHHDQNVDYNTVMTGSTSITSGDAQKMRGGKGYIPATFEEMIVQLQAYVPVLAALLGTVHPNVHEHQSAVGELIMHQALLKQLVTSTYGPKMGAAVIVYYFQLRHRNWFRTQWLTTTTRLLQPPDLVAGFTTFANSYTITWLPSVAHVDVLQRLAKPRAPSTPAPGGGRGPSGPVETPTGANAGGSRRVEDNNRRRVSNRNRDPRVMGENPLATRIRNTLIGDVLSSVGSAPLAENGNPRCLSWHLKGKCYSDCPRADDHVVLPSEEADKLVEWCEASYP